MNLSAESRNEAIAVFAAISARGQTLLGSNADTATATATVTVTAAGAGAGTAAAASDVVVPLSSSSLTTAAGGADSAEALLSALHQLVSQRQVEITALMARDTYVRFQRAEESESSLP